MILWPAGMLLLTVCLEVIFIANGREYFAISGGVTPTIGSGVFARSLAILGWLARLAFSGGNRHMYYPVIEQPQLSTMIVLGGAILLVIAAGMISLLRKPSLEGFAFAAFFLICLPYFQLIPYAPPSLVSDRLLSLACFPVMLLIVALAWRLRPIFRTTLLVLFALLWGFQTIERPRDWGNFETLINADLRTFPDYYMPAAYKITSFLLPRGQLQEAIKLADGIKNPEVRNIMNGVIRIRLGLENQAKDNEKLQEAINQLWKLGRDIKILPDEARLDTPLNNLWTRLPYILALEWKFLAQKFPGDASLQYNAGLWMLDFERYNDAIPYLRFSTESPELQNILRGNAYRSLGVALFESGHVSEAEIALRAALEQSPPELYANCTLVRVYRQTGHPEEAAQAESACPVKQDH